MEKRANKKRKKPNFMIWLNRVFTVVFYTVLTLALFFVTISKASGGEPEIFGYQLKTVQSGSMEQEFQTGSIIAVKPGGDMTRFEKGDVITFVAEDQKLITHRVVEVVESGGKTLYRTKGDNNNAADLNPVRSENVVAVYAGFTIPYLGYFVDFAKSQNGAFLLLIPGILLLCYAGFTIWRALSELDKSKKRLDQASEAPQSES
ncbi:signal peptidase, endoplasmic reticulum-type [Salinibacillus kushneri]|uniref:Signal peptidase I n=1 Tax=Salinibacillus kushneri TaxID=237682 RepID=A0A1I0JHI2_9BACI|nr:signal peptidase I [Salinibacillus kushneri]SEU09565.1 signal peptidase, endoplasmic reticulum-type [Salinibacillus kushneri]